jgi:PAS domain S-box-containing protein
MEPPDLTAATEWRLAWLEASGDGLWDWDLRSGVAHLSPNYYVLTGYSPGAVTVDLAFFQRLVHPDDLPGVMATMNAHLRGETRESVIEYRMLTASGAQRWIRGRGWVVARDAQGEPLRMMGYITDISEYKRIERQREQSLAGFMAILDSEIVGIAVVAERTIVWANATMHKMFGYEDGELLGQPTRIAYPDDETYQRFGEFAYASLREHGYYRGELPQRRKDGTLGWFEFHLSLLAGDELAAVGTIIDISERKRTEEALRASEARYRALVEDQTEVIARFRTDGTLLYVNEVYCRLFGRTVEATIGSQWQPDVHADDLPMIEARLAELSPDNPVVTIENRVYVASGHLRWMQFINRAFFDEAGAICELYSVGRDITPRKELELEREGLLAANMRLSRKIIRLQEQERAVLASELHDEIAQELAAIRAHAGAIERRQPDPGTQVLSDAAAIAAAADRIYKVSHRLMEGLHPQLLDNGGLVAALRTLLETQLVRSADLRIWLRTDVAADGYSPEIRIHIYRIVQECLANVLTHARAQRMRIFLGERRQGGRRSLRLVVRDDGVGIDDVAASRGYGLLLMRERAAILGGSFSRLGRGRSGVRIVVEVPLPP